MRKNDLYYLRGTNSTPSVFYVKFCHRQLEIGARPYSSTYRLNGQVCIEFDVISPIFTYTLYNVILRIARNFLENRENIKIDVAQCTWP